MWAIFLKRSSISRQMYCLTTTCRTGWTKLPIFITATVQFNEIQFISNKVYTRPVWKKRQLHNNSYTFRINNKNYLFWMTQNNFVRCCSIPYKIYLTNPFWCHVYQIRKRVGIIVHYLSQPNVKWTRKFVLCLAAIHIAGL